MSYSVRMKSGAVFSLLLLATTGCAGGQAAEKVTRRSAELIQTCAAFDPDYVSLHTAPSLVRPGTELTVSAVFQENPWSADRVPIACFDDWTLSQPDAAQWSADHSRLVVTQTAKPGALSITARLNGAQLTRSLVIVATDAVVLTGLWRQESVSCDDGASPSEPLRELLFHADGSWSGTFVPFEVRRDMEGQSAFDDTTGGLSLTIEGGNGLAANMDLSGEAKIQADGKLVLDGFWFGDGTDASAPGHSCRYVFQS